MSLSSANSMESSTPVTQSPALATEPGSATSSSLPARQAGRDVAVLDEPAESPTLVQSPGPWQTLRDKFSAFRARVRAVPVKETLTNLFKPRLENPVAVPPDTMDEAEQPDPVQEALTDELDHEENAEALIENDSDRGSLLGSLESVSSTSTSMTSDAYQESVLADSEVVVQSPEPQVLTSPELQELQEPSDDVSQSESLVDAEHVTLPSQQEDQVPEPSLEPVLDTSLGEGESEIQPVDRDISSPYPRSLQEYTRRALPRVDNAQRRRLRTEEPALPTITEEGSDTDVDEQVNTLWMRLKSAMACLKDVIERLVDQFFDCFRFSSPHREYENESDDGSEGFDDLESIMSVLEYPDPDLIEELEPLAEEDLAPCLDECVTDSSAASTLDADDRQQSDQRLNAEVELSPVTSQATIQPVESAGSSPDSVAEPVLVDDAQATQHIHTLPQASHHADGFSGMDPLPSTSRPVVGRPLSTDQIRRYLTLLRPEQRASVENTQGAAETFFRDLIQLNLCFDHANTLGWRNKKRYAEETIQPLVERMNAQADVFKRYADDMFNMLKIRDSKRNKRYKNLILEEILASVLQQVSLDQITLGFFIGYIQDYMNNNNLRENRCVNVNMTLKEAFGGGVANRVAGALAARMLPDFPHFRLQIDCTYGTLLDVLDRCLEQPLRANNQR